jgi:hypothetical protein
MKKSIFTLTGLRRYLLVAGIMLVAVILLANKLVVGALHSLPQDLSYSGYNS